MIEERECLECDTVTIWPDDIEFIDKHGHCRACALEFRTGTMIRKERDHE